LRGGKFLFDRPAAESVGARGDRFDLGLDLLPVGQRVGRGFERRDAAAVELALKLISRVAHSLTRLSEAGPAS